MAGIFNARPWRNVDNTGPSNPAPANDARPETPLQRRRREWLHIEDGLRNATEARASAISEHERLIQVWTAEMERSAGVVESATRDLEDARARFAEKARELGATVGWDDETS